MKPTFLLLILFITNSVLSQEFQGIAIYQSSNQMSIKMDSTQVSDKQTKELNAMIKSQFDNEFKLQFNKTKSLYKAEEKLKLKGAQASGTFVSTISFGQAPIYKNISTASYVKEEDLMGKKFLVKDNLLKPDWKMEPEQKKIGNYTVFKATWTRDVEVDNWDKEQGVTKTTVSKTTTAWYTPEIPVSHGPREYWGLPGLIMEIQEGKFSLLVTEIILNPKDKFTIIAPSKGKETDQATFDKIKEEKNKEMREQFNKGGESGKIRFGN